MGVDKKTTLMLIKVDLQCCRCYKKIKKVLCRIPQIQDQAYNEKENCVLIKVVCCSPEKIKQKIICQGGCAVKSIEIIEKPKEKPKPEEKPKPPPEAPKAPPPEAPKAPPPEAPKAPPPEAPKAPPPEAPKAPPPKNPDKPKETDDKPKGSEKPKEKPKESEKPKENPKETPPPPPQCPPPYCLPPHWPPPYCPPRLAYPEFRTCCTECSEGHGGGPCYSGHGRPPASYDGYYGRPIYDSYGGGWYRSSYVSQCDYFGEENSSGCSIM